MGIFGDKRGYAKILRMRIKEIHELEGRVAPGVISISVCDLEDLLDRYEYLEDMADVSFRLADRFKESVKQYGGSPKDV